MIRFGSSLLVLLTFFSVLLFAGRILGATSQQSWFAAMLAQDAHREDRGWCWRDLCPSRTLYKTVRSDIQGSFANYTMLAAGTTLTWEEADDTQRWSGRVHSASDELLAFAQLRPTLNTFTFGDAVFQFGQPIRVQIHGYIGFGTWLIFARFEHDVYAEMVLGEPRLKPSQPVLSISFDATGESAKPTDTYSRRNTISAWHGFSRLR